MTDTCTCAPDDCHGGHTINVGRPVTSAQFCGYGSCDRPPGHEGPHLCRCSKPVDNPANGCKWHTPGARLTDEKLRQFTEDVPPDEATRAAPWLHSMAAEPLALRPRVAELEADSIDRDFGIQAMSIAPGESTLSTKPTTERARQLVLAMSLACGRMLDEDQAPNYVEFEVSPANHAGYVVHVRRAEGRSPHTLRRDAEARAERAETRVAELEGVDREHAQLIAYLHYAHGIEIDREDDDFLEWQQQYGEVTDRG